MLNDCLFTFLAPDQLPQVSGPASAVFDSSSGEYSIVIAGSGFTDSASDIDFMLAGEAQTIKSVSETEIQVTVDSLTSGLTSNTMDLYLSVGIPNGYTELLDGISFTPKLLSLSTNEGSAAGSIITAVVKGVGANDKITLINTATGDDLCKTSRVMSYG